MISLRKPLRVEDRAAQELDAALLWYEERLVGLGRRFLDAVSITLDHIEAFPKTGALVPRVATHLSARRFPVYEFPFHVVCLEADDTLWVLAFAHDRRRPDYWRQRIPPYVS